MTAHGKCSANLFLVQVNGHILDFCENGINTILKDGDTNLDSKIAPKGHPGDKEEATEACILVRRGADDEGNKVI